MVWHGMGGGTRAIAHRISIHNNIPMAHVPRARAAPGSVSAVQDRRRKVQKMLLVITETCMVIKQGLRFAKWKARELQRSALCLSPSDAVRVPRRIPERTVP